MKAFASPACLVMAQPLSTPPCAPPQLTQHTSHLLQHPASHGARTQGSCCQIYNIIHTSKLGSAQAPSLRPFKSATRSNYTNLLPTLSSCTCRHCTHAVLVCRCTACVALDRVLICCLPSTAHTEGGLMDTTHPPTTHALFMPSP